MQSWMCSVMFLKPLALWLRRQKCSSRRLLTLSTAIRFRYRRLSLVGPQGLKCLSMRRRPFSPLCWLARQCITGAICLLHTPSRNESLLQPLSAAMCLTPLGRALLIPFRSAGASVMSLMLAGVVVKATGSSVPVSTARCRLYPKPSFPISASLSEQPQWAAVSTRLQALMKVGIASQVLELRQGAADKTPRHITKKNPAIHKGNGVAIQQQKQRIIWLISQLYVRGTKYIITKLGDAHC